MSNPGSLWTWICGIPWASLTRPNHLSPTGTTNIRSWYRTSGRGGCGVADGMVGATALQGSVSFCLESCRLVSPFSKKTKQKSKHTVTILFQGPRRKNVHAQEFQIFICNDFVIWHTIYAFRLKAALSHVPFLNIRIRGISLALLDWI